jgi:thiosulfate dehydrogenase
MAPADKKALVMEGFHLFLETKKLLPDNVGNTLCCCNCHFAGGNSLGGTNGGIPLVGVTQAYPRPLPDNKSISLKERINGCFQRSMNGTPIPPDGEAMNAFVAYLEWISSPVKKGEDPHWLGLKTLKSKHKPDAEHGKEVYARHCAACHGKDGQGMHQNYDLGYPPLWGEQSFNHGAGMNRINLIASFVYYNMPYQEPCLSVTDAIDVAAYVIKQNRPVYTPPKNDNSSVRPPEKH